MPIRGGKTYAQLIRDKLHDPQNRRSMREVGRGIGYSYEHVRKITGGELTFTREFNDALSRFLGLDAQEMWERAQSERLHKRFEGAELPADMPRDTRVREIWSALDTYQKEVWVRIGRDLAAVAERASRQARKA